MRDNEPRQKKPRNGGFGPFSGAQLTTIVCVIIAAVAFPVGAYAVVTGSNVFVTDATSGATAKVSAAGAVTVAGSVTSKLQGSTSANKVEVTGDQQLLTAEASPNAFYSSVATVAAGSFAAVLTPVKGQAVIVKSLRLSAYFTTGARPALQLYVVSALTCSPSITRDLGLVDLATGVNTTTVLPFDPGLPIPEGSNLCVQTSFDAQVDVAATGYTVPTAVVPAATPLQLPRGHS